MKIVLIDPPDGARYGFPKRYSGDLDKLDLGEWLVSNGYPVELIKDCPGGVICRIVIEESVR